MSSFITGVVEVWRIEDFELVSQPAEMVGVFFGGDSYVVLYTYKKDRKDCFVVYYWLVSKLAFLLFTVVSQENYKPG